MSKEPRTTQDWLALPEDKLGRALGEALTPGPWKHDLLPEHPTIGMPSCCSKCREVSPICGPCPAPDPIDIKDWNVAMAWRDKADKTNFLSALELVWDNIRPGYFSWCNVAMDSQPEHYLIAAALAVERKEE